MEPQRPRLGKGPAVALAALVVATAAGCGRSPRAVGLPAPRPLRLAIHAEPTALDPHLQSESISNSVLSNLVEGLTVFDAEMRIAPALAERWESPDELTWVLHLRPEVKFHDGREVTAADVLFSLERARDHPESRVASFLVALGSWRALDERTIELRTVRPYPILLNKLALVMIVPRGSPDPLVAPVGTGPYRLVSRRPGEIVLAAHRDHWRGEPANRDVTFAVVASGDERVDGLLAGRWDLITEVPPARRASLRGAPAARLVGHDSLSVSYLQLPADRPPFDDRRLRQAIHLALDRPALIREMVAGLGVPVGQMVGPNVFGFVPDLEPPARDLPRARQLVAEVGGKMGIDLELVHRPGREIAPLLAQLAEAGLRVRSRPVPWELLYPRLQSGEVGFYYGGFSCTSGDASDLFDSKVHSRDAASGYGSTHTAGISSPLLDRLIEVAGVSGEMGERRQMLAQAMRELMAELTLVPLYVPRVEYGVRRDLAWQPRLDGHLRAAEIWRSGGR